MKKEITTQIIPINFTNILSVTLPESVVVSINTHIDSVIADRNKVSYRTRLAGEITSGEQTGLNPDHPDLNVLKQIYLEASNALYKDFYSAALNPDNDIYRLFGSNPRIDINDMWYNVYKDGDYNPLHCHSTRARMGLSSFLFLKLPSQITTGTANLNGAHGNNDGKTCFYYGNSGYDDFYNWKYPTGITLDPKVGQLFIFPKWMQHLVYPFRGEGERRTLAANVNIWAEGER